MQTREQKKELDLNVLGAGVKVKGNIKDNKELKMPEKKEEAKPTAALGGGTKDENAVGGFDSLASLA